MTGRCRITVMAAVVIVCALIFLSGCDNGDSGLDDFKQLLSDSAESEESTEKSFAEKVYLITPRDCSPELSSAAAELAVDTFIVFTNRIFFDTDASQFIKMFINICHGLIRYILRNRNRLVTGKCS